MTIRLLFQAVIRFGLSCMMILMNTFNMFLSLFSTVSRVLLLFTLLSENDEWWLLFTVKLSD